MISFHGRSAFFHGIQSKSNLFFNTWLYHSLETRSSGHVPMTSSQIVNAERDPGNSRKKESVDQNMLNFQVICADIVLYKTRVKTISCAHLLPSGCSQPSPLHGALCSVEIAINLRPFQYVIRVSRMLHSNTKSSGNHRNLLHSLRIRRYGGFI
jgi:hypothetical protein